MANGNGSTGHWKDWLLGFLVPSVIALIGIVWNQADNNTIKLDLNAKELQVAVSSINQDIAVIKQQITYINERLTKQENRTSTEDRLKSEKSWRSHNP